MGARRIMVFGAGSRLAGDEAAGIAVVEELAAQELPEGVSVLEIGTDGYALLSELAEDVDLAIVVDCAKMGHAPGTVAVFGPDEVEDLKPSRGLSLHSLNLLETIRVAQVVNPRTRFRIVGIEPERVELLESLSETVARAIPLAVERVKAEIERAIRGD